MKGIKEKLTPFFLGITATVLIFLIYTKNNTTPDVQQTPIKVNNLKFVGGIPIVSDLGKEPKCIDSVEFYAPITHVLGITEKGGWLLLSYMGRSSGWIPASSVMLPNEGNQTNLLIVGTEPIESYTPPNNNQYVQAIENIIGIKEIKPYFVCSTYISKPQHIVSVYIDDTGGVYHVSDETFQVVKFTNGYELIKDSTAPSIPNEELEKFAENYLSKNSRNFRKYFDELQINFLGRGDIYFSYYYTYTGYLHKPVDGLNQAEIQITFLSNGTIIGYINTLDFIEDT
jgi:hypothetical protein